MTYTYAVLEVSRASFEDIKARLVAAGHSDAIDPDDPLLPDGVLDMHGIALKAEESMFLKAAKDAQTRSERKHGRRRST